MNASPELVKDLQTFVRGAAAFAQTEFAVDPREEIDGPFCAVTVVFKRDGDVIFQLFPKKLGTRGGGGRWPSDEAAARDLLARLIDQHFGSTDRFSAAWTPELKSWAVHAAGLSERATYDKERHVYGFAQYINQALANS